MAWTVAVLKLSFDAYPASTTLCWPRLLLWFRIVLWCAALVNTTIRRSALTHAS